MYRMIAKIAGSLRVELALEASSHWRSAARPLSEWQEMVVRCNTTLVSV